MIQKVYTISQSVGLSWTLTQYEEHAQLSNVFYFVNEVGFASVSVIFDEAELINIAVMPNAQKQGVATRLWAEILQYFDNKGVKKCFLEVRKSNEKARKFYEKCGFFVISERQAYYQEPIEDAVIYCWEKI